MVVSPMVRPSQCFLQHLVGSELPIYAAYGKAYGIVGREVQPLRLLSNRDVCVPMGAYTQEQLDEFALDLLNFAASLQSKVPISKVSEEFDKRDLSEGFRVIGTPHLRLSYPEFLGVRPVGDATTGLAITNLKAVFELSDLIQTCPCGICPQDCDYHK